MFDPLLAISPVDGRYATKTDPLRKYLSEYALIKTRVCIEIKWLIALSREKNITEIQPLSQEWEDFLENLVQHSRWKMHNTLKPSKRPPITM